MFYLNSTLNFRILPVFVFQLEVYYKVDRLLTGLTAQQKVITVRWYSNKTSLLIFLEPIQEKLFSVDKEESPNENVVLDSREENKFFALNEIPENDESKEKWIFTAYESMNL